jgi:hypothetical protein
MREGSLGQSFTWSVFASRASAREWFTQEGRAAFRSRLANPLYSLPGTAAHHFIDPLLDWFAAKDET